MEERETVSAVFGEILTRTGSILDEEESLLPLRDLPPLPRNGTWGTFTTVDGLAGLRVEHIVQDREGNLWFATATSGVSRFDGRRWRTFTRGDGLAGNQVMVAQSGRGGRLWFGTWDGGLCWWDGTGFQNPSEEVARRPVSHLFEDGAGRLWFVGKENLGYWDGSVLMDLFPLYRQFGLAAPYTCWGMAEDGKGRLWLGTSVGVLRYDGSRFEVVFPHESPQGCTCVAGDGRGGLWLSAAGYLWHGDGERFTRFHELEESCEVRKIQLDREDRPWFGLNNNCGVLFADAGGLHSFTEEDGLEGPVCAGMAQDAEDRFWLATWGNGVGCYDPHTIERCLQPLPASGSRNGTPRALLCASDGTVWLGLSAVSPTETIGFWDGVRFRFIEQVRDSFKCLAIAEAGNGCLYFGTHRGLLHWDGDSLHRVDVPEGQESWEMDAVCSDGKGGIFFGINAIPLDQILLYHYDGRCCRQVFCIEERQGIFTKLILDREGILWCGVSGQFGHGLQNGLLRVGEEPRWYTLDEGLLDDRVQDLLVDWEGKLWIATFGGLSCFDGERFRNYTVEDGLGSNSVLCLCQDNRGRIWCGTEAGLAVFDGRVFQNIRSAHIGPTQALTADARGGLWCATLSNGVVRYTPGTKPPQVAVTRVTADQVHVQPAVLQAPVSTSQVVFEFQGVSSRFLLGELRYVHCLRGYDKGWQKATERTRAVYTGLPLGEYVFEVQAVDVDLNYSEVARVRLAVVPDPHIEALQDVLREGGSGYEFVGDSPALRQLKAEIAEAASTDLPVLVLGETGTGKGVTARAVHRVGSQRHGPFLQISCGAIPGGLLESELFGHEQGAFTGAHSRKVGRVELAAGGTLFLDEIGDMSLEGQVKLLRLLEEGVFERVGGMQTLRAQVRVVAATNRDLGKMITEGNFRADLFYRLQGFVLGVPSLRERLEDIPLLAAYFAEGMAVHLNRTRPELSAGALAVLQGHDWPGNVRELEHVVKRAVVVCRGGVIRAEDLGIERGVCPIVGDEEYTSLEEVERRYIRHVLERTGWVIEGERGAAEILEMKPSTLRFRIRKLGLKRP